MLAEGCHQDGWNDGEKFEKNDCVTYFNSQYLNSAVNWGGSRGTKESPSAQPMDFLSDAGKKVRGLGYDRAQDTNLLRERLQRLKE